MVMAASDRFTKLGEQIDRAQGNIEAAAHQDEAELGAKVAEAQARRRSGCSDAGQRAEGF
jgi:hypothetical protein